MVRHCCVPFCHNDTRKSENITFHALPKDENLREQWLINIQREAGPNFSVSKSTTVCSSHFTPNSFVIDQGQLRRHLKVGSVPTVFQWSVPKEPHRKVKQQDVLVKKKLKSSQHQPEHKSSILKTPIWDTAKISQFSSAQKKLPFKDTFLPGSDVMTSKSAMEITRTKSGRTVKKPKLFEPEVESRFPRKENTSDSASPTEKKVASTPPKDTVVTKSSTSIDNSKNVRTISAFHINNSKAARMVPTFKSSLNDKFRQRLSMTNFQGADNIQVIDSSTADQYYRDFQVTEVIGKAPCSLYCPEQYGSLPTLPCVKCFCLFHPQCVRLAKCPSIYVCPTCTAQSKVEEQENLSCVEVTEVGPRFGDAFRDDHCYSLSVKCKDKR